MQPCRPTRRSRSDMRCDVVAVGTELLLGQIVDTNSAWIGEQLAASGLDSLLQVKVGDNLGRIVDVLRRTLGCRRRGDRVRRARADARRSHPRGDRRGDGRRAAHRRPPRRGDHRDVRHARPADGGEQPAPGARARRGDDHPADPRHRTWVDLPGDERWRRQGDLRRAGRATRDARHGRACRAARPAGALWRTQRDRQPRPADLGRERERTERAPRRGDRAARRGR